MQFVKAIPFHEAARKLGARSVIGSKLSSEEWSNTVPLALRDRSFFAARIASANLLQRARNSIADFLSSNLQFLRHDEAALKTGSRADFIKQLQDFAIAEGIGPLDPADEGTIKDIRTEQRLGLIFDVQTRQAQDYGYWKQGQDPDVLDAFPAQRFIRERASKVPRDYHVHHEGEVRLKSDLGFWTALNHDFGVPWGPWGWGCGHAVEDVDRATAERLRLLKPGQRAKPVAVDFNHKLEASVQNLDPDLQSKLKDAFGDQVEIKHGTARWKP